MLCQTSQFLFSFLCLFMLYMVTEGITCQAGQRLKDGACKSCPEGEYQPKPGNNIDCLICLTCGKRSRKVSSCTKISNTQCDCLPGFISVSIRREVCRCQRGYGIIYSENGKIKECKKCESGTFTSNFDSVCQPMKKCDKSGVKTPGNATFDTICENAETALPPATSRVLQTTLYLNTSTLAPTTTKLNRNTNPPSAPSSAPPVSRQHGLWLAPLGCILALLLVQFVIIKLKVTTCFPKDKKSMIRQDSACKKPVEESGGKLLLPADV